jgi:hypothetical protein
MPFMKSRDSPREGVGWKNPSPTFITTETINELNTYKMRPELSKLTSTSWKPNCMR